jgi:hypothetical protein
MRRERSRCLQQIPESVVRVRVVDDDGDVVAG